MTTGLPASSLREFLAQLTPFQSLLPPALERLAAHARESSFQKGETIYSEGEHASSVWFVRNGRVEILKYSSDGRPFAIESLGPGEIFGALCRLTGNKDAYPCTAVAQEPSMVLEISDDLFRELYSHEPVVMAELCALCSQRLTRMQAFTGTSREPVKRRIASVLLQLCDIHGPDIRCSKQELAELAGTSAETAVRIASSFARKGWIASSRGRISVKARASLERLVRRS